MAKRPDANDILRSQGHEGVRRAIAEAEVVTVEKAPSRDRLRPNGDARGNRTRLLGGLRRSRGAISSWPHSTKRG